MSFLMDDHDEFEDDWDDFTPSAQDTLYEKLESIENSAAAAKQEVCLPRERKHVVVDSLK